MTATEAPTIPVPEDRRSELRIKIKSLALEAMAIRKEERRHLAKARRAPDVSHKSYHHSSAASLHGHRTKEVREESRYAQLTLAYILGRKYRGCEQKTLKGNEPDLKRLSNMAFRFYWRQAWYGPSVKPTPEFESKVAEWLAAS